MGTTDRYHLMFCHDLACERDAKGEHALPFEVRAGLENGHGLGASELIGRFSALAEPADVRRTSYHRSHVRSSFAENVDGVASDGATCQAERETLRHRSGRRVTESP